MPFLTIRMILLPAAVLSFLVELEPPSMLKVGDRLVLTCKVTVCSEQPEFSWSSLEDKPLDAKVTDNVTESNLVFDPVKPEHENMILCKVRCGSTTKEKKAHIKVYSFPKDPVISGYDFLLEGESKTLTCEVPDFYTSNYLTVLWLQGGTIFYEDGAHTDSLTTLAFRYTYTPRMVDDGQKITCRAILDFEGVPEDCKTRETTVTLNVRSPPRNTTITVNPDGRLMEGDNVTISCHSDVLPGGHVVLRRVSDGWKTDPQSSNSSFASVSLPSALQSDSGLYECEASNQHGRQNVSTRVSVEVFPLEVELSPGNGVLTVERGSSLVLSCRAFNCPRPRFYWKSTLDEPAHSKIETQDSVSQIFLSSADLMEEEAYTCEVQCGSLRKGKHTEIKLFSFSHHPIIENHGPFLEGEAATINCTVQDVFPANLLQIQWLDGNRVLRLEEGVFTSDVQKLTSTLSFKPEPSDQGKAITCRATLKMEGVAGNRTMKSAVTTITLHHAPRNTAITVTTDGELKEGDNVTISCHSVALPAGHVVLRKVSDDQGTDLQSSGQSSASISLPFARLSHSGLYECESSNQYGKQNVSTQLRVRAPPRNTTVQVFPSWHVREGQNITICCLSVSFPLPAVVLRKVGDSTELYSTNGTFLLWNLKTNDTGLYQVNFTNDLGYETEIFNISVMERYTSPPSRWHEIIMFTLGLVTMIATTALVIHYLRMSRRKGFYELAKGKPGIV